MTDYDALLREQGRNWRAFLDMAGDGEIDLAAAIVSAAVEWAEARTATLSEPIADVRKSDTFGAALNRLASAEDALAAAVRKLQERK